MFGKWVGTEEGKTLGICVLKGNGAKIMDKSNQKSALKTQHLSAIFFALNSQNIQIMGLFYLIILINFLNIFPLYISF